jgi:hypothetical protein
MMTPEALERENDFFRATGGVSQGNGQHAFCSAFWDSATGRIFLSRFRDGRQASVHVLDGLPEDLVLERDSDGRVLVVKDTVVAGFLHADHFYTREQVSLLLAKAL